MDYKPHFYHLVLSIVLAIVLMWISAFVKNQRVATALMIGSGSFFIAFLVFLWTHVMAANDNHWWILGNFADTYGKLDEESRAALGFQFPYLRYRMKKGRIGEYFEDTNATIEHFRLFLLTGNDRYISPKRDWYTKEQPEWAWLEIQDWLENNDYILADSAAGQHSWLWKGNAYKHLCAYWLAGRQLHDYNKGTEAVYAYEVEEQELA